MRSGNIGLFSFTIIFITSSLITVADDIPDNTVSLDTRIATLQNDMRALCSHMESKTLSNAALLKSVINKVHARCPTIESMDSKLVNIEDIRAPNGLGLTQPSPAQPSPWAKIF
jgi:signal transduction histidine kinase